MKPIYVKNNNYDKKVLQIRRDKMAYFPKVWHFHQEIELVLILKSSGTRFIGDSIENFSEGDLVIVGSNLPHSWQNGKEYLRGDQSAEAIVLHFKDDFLGDEFLKLQELREVRELLSKAKMGIKFYGNIRLEIEEQLINFPSSCGLSQVIEFLKILSLMAKTKQYKLLASTHFAESYSKINHHRIDEIYEYIINNISKEITLDEVAALAHMNSSAFSRFFKKKTKNTFSKFLNETRIGFARKLIMEKQLNITQVAFECGYKSVSNFNKQFKRINGVTPKEYQRNMEL